jgi:hypothetical protein
MYAGFTLAAAGVFHGFLRARSGPRAAWIASIVVVLAMTALGCALAIWVLPAALRLMHEGG